MRQNQIDNPAKIEIAQFAQFAQFGSVRFALRFGSKGEAAALAGQSQQATHPHRCMVFVTPHLTFVE